MEIADIFVVNKADREGADRTVAAVEAMLSLKPAEPPAWRTPVLKTEATAGKGVGTLLAEIARYRSEMTTVVGRRRHQRSQFRLRELVGGAFMRRVQDVVSEAEMTALADRITDRSLDPYAAAEEVVARVCGLHP